MSGSTTLNPAPNAASVGAAHGCDVFQANTQLVAELRAKLIPQPLVTALAETFKVLGDPTRVRILNALSATELCVCDIATLLKLGESAVSHQLRILRSLRLVRARRDGRKVFYALDDEHITRLLAQGLEHVAEALPGAGGVPHGGQP
jgi:ArsR family transcriptional regulator, lead/cadmium/zinc/bismuth-responsive transcriptional repressor